MSSLASEIAALDSRKRELLAQLKQVGRRSGAPAAGRQRIRC
jgi:hypothetical protein